MKKIIIPVLILLVPFIVIVYFKLIYLFSSLLLENEYDRIFATIFSILPMIMVGSIYFVERDNDTYS